MASVPAACNALHICGASNPLVNAPRTICPRQSFAPNHAAGTVQFSFNCFAQLFFARVSPLFTEAYTGHRTRMTRSSRRVISRRFACLLWPHFTIILSTFQNVSVVPAGCSLSYSFLLLFSAASSSPPPTHPPPTVKSRRGSSATGSVR